MFRLRFRRTRRFTRLRLVYGRFSVFPSVIFFFQILPPFAEIYEQQEEEVSWGGCLAGRRPYRGGDICISEISALSAARYIELVYFGRRTRPGKRHFYEEPAGYAHKYGQYILLAGRQSFSCVKYFKRR